MKIKIFTEGGKDVGLGHLSRCSSLYDEIKSRGIAVDFVVFGNILDIGFSAGINIINENWLEKSYLIKNISSDDFVIVDSYLAKKEIYGLVAKLSKKALYIDDIGRLEYPEGIIVNPSLDSGHIDYSGSPNSILLSGSDYVILRPQFSRVKRKNISNEVKRVLITMGGTDIRGLTTLIANNICKNRSDIEFDIVIGTKDIGDYQERVTEYSNITLHTNLNADQMVNVMLNADLAITAAGQTIYELLATQTPFIPIQIIGNQENNVRSLLKYNPQQIILRFDDSDLVGNLNKTLELYSSIEYRKNHNWGYKNLIDGRGPKRIVDYLLKDANKIQKIYLRKVKPEDMKKVFELSNQDHVRLYSINKEKIQWTDHVHWFNLVIQDKDTVFYVVTDKNETFLGQIRYKIAHNSATVSISLSEELKGRGLSKELLGQSIKKLFEEEQSIKDIVAFVSSENIASEKIFKGLRFQTLKVEDNIMKLILKREDFHVN